MKTKTTSRILTLVLLVCMLFTMTVSIAQAASYKIGKATVTDSFVSHCSVCGKKLGSGTHGCCWQYAAQAYRKIWGVSFARNSRNNALRNIPAADRKMTAQNLAWFMSQAQPGAVLRIDKNSSAYAGDNNGHSLVFLKLGSDGAWFYEGNYDGKGHARVYYWKWTQLANQYKRYTYIKYIIWPNAKSMLPVIKVLQPGPTISCSGVNYPTSLKKGNFFGLRGTITTNGKLTQVMGEILDSKGRVVQTCTYRPNSSSLNIRYTVNEKMIFNWLGKGTYTYRVTATATKNGKTITKVIVSKVFTVR